MAFEIPATVAKANPAIAQLQIDAARVAWYLRCSSVLCLLLAVGFLTGTFLRTHWHRDALASAHTLSYGGAAELVLLLAFLVAVSATVIIAPVAIRQAVGSLAILLVFIVTLAFLVDSSLPTSIVTGCPQSLASFCLRFSSRLLVGMMIMRFASESAS
jgi:hypothetical protein